MRWLFALLALTIGCSKSSAPTDNNPANQFKNFTGVPQFVRGQTAPNTVESDYYPPTRSFYFYFYIVGDCAKDSLIGMTEEGGRMETESNYQTAYYLPNRWYLASIAEGHHNFVLRDSHTGTLVLQYTRNFTVVDNVYQDTVVFRCP
jgi:hypothetical protein